MAPGERAVVEALAGLRPGYRRVITELYYRGCSVSETAVVLGVSSAAVKSLALHAVKALRLALEERGLWL